MQPLLEKSGFCCLQTEVGCSWKQIADNKLGLAVIVLAGPHKAAL